MPEFDPDKFRCHMDSRSGQFTVWYAGKVVPRWHGSQGSREFFVINKQFFVKCAYGEFGSQCKTEVYQYAKIEPEDRQYFAELVYACDFKSVVHWTVWRYYDLEPWNTYEDRAQFEYWQDKVMELCNYYGIADVKYFFNGNWWIHDGKPLIVDLGCD